MSFIIKARLVQKRYASVFESKLLKVSASTALSASIKVLSAVLLSKIVAVQLGPGGLAQVGQLTGFVSIALLLATGGFTNGIIKNTAELKGDALFIKQSFKLTLIISACCGILIMLLSNFLSKICLGSSEYNFVFIALGLTISLYSANTYFIALINGFSDYRRLNKINIINSILSVMISGVLIYFFGLKGAFVAVVLNQTVSCIISFLYIHSYTVLLKGFWAVKINFSLLEKLFPFSIMALVTAALLPVLQIFMRNHLIEQFGTVQAGHWEAINRISGLYLTVLLSVMLVYYLPKLSSTQEKQALRAEIKKGFKFFSPLIIVFAASVFLMRKTIISLFLAKSFAQIEDYFFPQLIGDIFKILSYLYAYLVISKALTLFFIITEVSFMLLYAALFVMLVKSYGVAGGIYAYAITYGIYFIVQFVFIGKIYLNEDSNSNSWIWKKRWI